MVGSDTCFLKESEGVSLKVATNNSLRDKKAMKKFISLGFLSKAKAEECDQRDRSFCDKFGIFIVLSDVYFLKVSAHVVLKVANKDYFRDNETIKI